MDRSRGRRWKVRVGLVLVGLVVSAGVLGPSLAPYAADARDERAVLAGPSDRHWLGTDEEGRDLLSLLLLGARIALIVGIGTVLVSGTLGTAVGLASGYAGGGVDLAIQRLVEVVLSFPGILLAILLIFVTGRPGVGAVVLALAATGWASYARIVRGQVLTLRGRSFVEAARALGLSPTRVVVQHLLPSVAGPVGVLMTFHVASAILAEAGLSFLGLGPQEGTSWGALLEQGAVLFVKTPAIGMLAGLAIAGTVVGVNLIGDALRDRLDPDGAA